jgi:hypothetical protein
MSELTVSEQRQVLEALEHQAAQAIYQLTIQARVIKSVDEKDKRLPSIEKLLMQNTIEREKYQAELEALKSDETQ